MPDYHTPTVIQQILPHQAISPLERLILGRMFDAERHESGLYLSSSEGPATDVMIVRALLVAALETSQDFDSSLSPYVAERLKAGEGAPDSRVETIDMSGFDWAFILQDILKRAPSLNYITVIQAFTVSKMCPEGWGGAATLVTRDAILSQSTTDVLEQMLENARCDSEPTERTEAA